MWVGAKQDLWKSQAENYNNSIYPPLFTAREEKTFLRMIPPPELYLILGVVNALFINLLAELEDDMLLGGQNYATHVLVIILMLVLKKKSRVWRRLI